MTKLAIAGATGFVGNELVNNWRSKGREVIFIGRSSARTKQKFGDSTEVVEWDELEDSKSLFTDVKTFVNFSGAGIADKRWSKSRKQEILQSRITYTKKISDFCGLFKNNNPVLINASAVGIYGLQKNSSTGLKKPLDETSAIAPSAATDFLSSVCKEWENATDSAKESGIRTINLRLGVVLGKNGGALNKMALPFSLFMGGPIGTGLQPVPWVSIDDVINIIEHIIVNKEISGPVNAVAPNCLTQKEFAKTLGKCLRRPSLITSPGFAMKLVLGQMAEELLLSGQNVAPKKLLDSNFKFTHSTLQSALESIYR